MPEALLSQHTVSRVIGASRLKRLIRVECRRGLVLFNPRDVHAALSRAEKQRCPPDQIESIRVAKSKERNGHAYVPKKKEVPVWDLDFSAFKL